MEAIEVGKLHIRWMIRRDMAEVIDIETMSYDYGWIEEDFLRQLRARNCIAMVCEKNQKIVGFMVYELHKNHLSVANMAVHPAYRRTGIGAAMVAKLVNKLCSHRRPKICLDIRETNLTAQLFLRSQGFLAKGIKRDFYEDEDAFSFQYVVSDED